jgi:hypothetical protein
MGPGHRGHEEVTSHEENPFAYRPGGGTGHRIRGRAAAGADAGCTGQRRRLLHRHQPDPGPRRPPDPRPDRRQRHREDNCQLGLGNDSVAVARLQIALDSLCNFSAGLAVDNDYGPLTEAAVAHAQSEYGIPVDGIYGPQTRNVLWWPVAGMGPNVCEQI